MRTVIYRRHCQDFPCLTHCARVWAFSCDKWQSTLRRLCVEMTQKAGRMQSENKWLSFPLSWVPRWELFTLFALLCHVDTLLPVRVEMRMVYHCEARGPHNNFFCSFIVLPSWAYVTSVNKPNAHDFDVSSIWNQNLYIDDAANWTTKKSGFDIRRGKSSFSCLWRSERLYGIQPSGCFPGVKRAGREAERSSPSSAGDDCVWSCTSTVLCFHIVELG